ncbi:DUF4294 domain-containing protein [Flavobacterium sp. TSSA_36]|uniref:DUF4294 domain-containing protein n=1 Tax=Flavobacterium sp. TSSA_36 TaxID=3447669 RepID=UPI003F374CDF
MNRIYLFLLFLIGSNLMQAQIIKKDSLTTQELLIENDSILSDTILLPEIIISKQNLSLEDKKQFLILQNRVYKTYPYAKFASERLVALRKGMSYLKTNKEKKKYFKIVEDYLTNEFEDKLKKLSRKQGQILVKLIHRQTGITTYDLVTDLKNGWKAFWANTTARVFDINLKTKYQPYEVNEDFLIETILTRAFDSGRLQNQPSAFPINFEDLNQAWLTKANTQK